VVSGRILRISAPAGRFWAGGVQRRPHLVGAKDPAGLGVTDLRARRSPAAKSSNKSPPDSHVAGSLSWLLGVSDSGFPACLQTSQVPARCGGHRGRAITPGRGCGSPSGTETDQNPPRSSASRPEPRGCGELEQAGLAGGFEIGLVPVGPDRNAGDASSYSGRAGPVRRPTP